MENVLNFTTHKKWTLYVANFENYTTGSGSWSKTTFLEKKSPEEFHQIVLSFENANRTRKRRDVIYYYWVSEVEVMEDDRSKFGHKNQSSEKGIITMIPKTYVRGEVFTIAEALEKIQTVGKSSEAERTQLIEFIYDSPINTQYPIEEEFLQKIVKIPGEGKRETFYEFFDEYSVLNVFPEEKLIPINMD